MIVVDASVCGPWFLSDETSTTSDRAEAILKADSGIVPNVWSLEIRNLLVVAHRRRRLTRVELDLLLSKVSILPIGIDVDADINDVVDLALRRDLSVYDASYLEVAVRRNVALATLDHRLAAAASLERVELIV